MENNGIQKINEIYKFADNRDKLIKVISYLSKLISIYYKNKNKNLANSFLTLYLTTFTSRKVFNLFRSFFEPNIFTLFSELHSKKYLDTNNKYQIILNITQQISTFFFFIFNKLELFFQINFFSSNNKRILISCFANFFHIILIVTKIINNIEKIYNLILSKSSFSKEKEYKLKLIRLLIVLSGNVLDLITIFNKSKIIKFIFGKNLNETLICLSGIWSGIVSLYNTIF